MNLNEFRTSFPGIAPARGGGEIALITESGYMMLVKSLNDDLAWGVQRPHNVDPPRLPPLCAWSHP